VEKVIRIGLDTSKEFFQLHGVGASEQVVLKKQLRRGKVAAFFAKLEPTVIGLEACGGSHHWARVLSGLGHEVRLVAPQHAKRYVKRGKNDAADAAAICEAMSRPDMTFVAPKSLEQQAGLMLIGVRNRLVRNRTQLGNAIRGHAAEFGLIAAKGLAKIEPLLERIAQDAGIPEVARRLFALQGKEYRRLEQELSAVEDELMAWHKADACSRRLAEIPGIGPIGGTMLAVKAPEVKSFRSGRYFAAWIGMTPKDHSTAGKSRQGGITRAGDPALRSVLVVGAMAVIRQAERSPERASPWLLKLLERKPRKLAAVALANKHARIAWKLIMTGERYDAGPHRPQAGVAAA
jgi:transposase